MGKALFAALFLLVLPALSQAACFLNVTANATNYEIGDALNVSGTLLNGTSAAANSTNVSIYLLDQSNASAAFAKATTNASGAYVAVLGNLTLTGRYNVTANATLPDCFVQNGTLVNVNPRIRTITVSTNASNYLFYGSASISGLLLNDSNAGIPGVNVSIYVFDPNNALAASANATTNQSGVYNLNFSGITVYGMYNVTVNASTPLRVVQNSTAFRAYPQFSSLSVSANESTYNLTETANVSGVVFNASGTRVANVNVTLNVTDPWARQALYASALSGADGSYSFAFSLPLAGPYNASVLASTPFQSAANSSSFYAVSQNCSADVRFDSVFASAGQGASIVFNGTARNKASAAQGISFSATCGSFICTLSQNPLSLDASASKNFTFALILPQDAQSGTIQLDALISGCTQAHVFNITVPSAPAPPAPTDFIGVALSEVQPMARPGEKALFDITVTNLLGNLTLVDMQGPDELKSNPFPQGAVSLNPVAFDLQPGTTNTSRFAITVPLDAPGGQYVFPVRIRAMYRGVIKTRDVYPTATVYVFSGMANLTFTDQPSGCIQAAHENETSVDVKILNQGDIDGSKIPFRAKLSNDADALGAVASPDRFELKTGEMKKIAILLTPARTVAPGDYSVNFGLTYGGFTLLRKIYCVSVSPRRGALVSELPVLGVAQGQSAEYNATVENTGTVAANYSLVLPSIAGVEMRAVPASFELAPDESRSVALRLSAAQSAKPGDYNANATLSAASFRQGVALKVRVAAYSAPRVFGMDAPSTVEAVPGAKASFNVSVENLLGDEQRGIAITLAGIPSAWYSVSRQDDFEANEVRTITVQLNVPQNAAVGRYNATLNVSSYSGSSAAAITITVSAAEAKLSYSYAVSNVTEGGRITQLLVSVRVRNDGNARLSGVSPLLELPGWSTVAEPESLSLEPGQEKSMLITLSPPPASNISSFELRMQSDKGVSAVRAIPLPPIVAAAPYEFPWKIAIIIVLLVAIVAVATRQRK
jgi:uncharacterized membrane protein